jgi:hypothetical protein
MVGQLLGAITETGAPAQHLELLQKVVGSDWSGVFDVMKLAEKYEVESTFTKNELTREPEGVRCF